MRMYWGSPESKWFLAASLIVLLVGTVVALLVR